jgi:hypothetical protein
MTTQLSTFAKDIQPESTIFFGAGSSLPSHAASISEIIAHLSKTYGQSSDGFTLAELSELIDQKTKDRQRMISEVRSLFSKIRPTGGLLNIPLYEWKALYTTNYDELIEEAYKRAEKSLIVYSSNFDFTLRGNPVSTKLFKLHGTISKDTSSGDNARLILTSTDYNFTEEYREKLYDRFKADLRDSSLVIIGHSLADPDIKAVINRAMALDVQALSSGRITLLMYTPDSDRAILEEGKGLRVVFGGIDEFFAELASKRPLRVSAATASEDPLDRHPSLRPTTLDVSHEVQHASADVSRMFSGWPATYADIAAMLTFERTISGQIREYFQNPDSLCAVILGAAGVGKTTAARQVMLKLRQDGRICWEHKGDSTLQVQEWLAVARDLPELNKLGAIFIDDAHEHLHELNELVDGLVSEKLTSLKMIVASSRNNWRPRVKTPNLFKVGKESYLSRLDGDEIEKLLSLVENNRAVQRLVEDTFAGFSRREKRRRLVERAEADMFVCMRNIFASESFDDIILREYADLADPDHPSRGEGYQEIYRYIAALESAGVHVHRQLVIRLLGIPAESIGAVLDALTDIVTEYTIDEKEHIYGWKGRHPVIDLIITKYNFSDMGKIIDLFEKVIDNIVPTYDIEIRSIRELCNLDYGITRIPDKKVQNRLLRKMISIAPGERVPRHRLIRNLIDMGDFDQAQTEIRIFEKDFRSDGPVARYKIKLMVARAIRTPGLMQEDRVVILEQAREEAVVATRRYEYTPQVFGAYADVGFEIFRLTGRTDVFDAAMAELKEAENRIGDPQITRIIRRFQRRMAGQPSEDSGTGATV